MHPWLRRRAVCAAMLVLGCAGKQGALDASFDTQTSYDGGKAATKLEAELDRAAPPTVPVAVGVTDGAVLGVRLDGGPAWRREMPVDARPVLAGELVVVRSLGNLVALDARDGTPQWQVPAFERSVRGAGDDGDLTAISLGAESGGQSMLLVVDRSGKVRLQGTPEVDIGKPAVLDGVVFVPWRGQYVAAIDGATGRPRARMLFRELVSRAERIGDQVYFGEGVLVRFDDDIASAAAGKATRYQLPSRSLPGSPVWFRPGQEVAGRQAGAADKVSLWARPAPGDGHGFDANRYFMSYYRLLLGLHAENAGLHWVRTLDHDVVGGAALVGGVAVCDQVGKVSIFEAGNGAPAGVRELGSAVSSCVVSAGDFEVPATDSPIDLTAQLEQALLLHDPQLAAAQQLLLQELGQLESPAVTRVLVELVSDPRTSPELLSEASELLASRRTGAEYMLEALEGEYDFLSGNVLPPPVGPMADALAAMNEQRAAPLLARHLNDPANGARDVKRAAQALVKLGTPAELDELRTFFALYRATADQKDLVEAVIAIAQAILRVGDEDDQRLVRQAADDPLTHPLVRRTISDILREKPAARAAG